jgi:hypothetical protein
MDQLNHGMQDELAAIRHRDAIAQHESKADSAIAELEWKMWGLMIQSGLILAPIIAVLVIIGVIWIWVV